MTLTVANLCDRALQESGFVKFSAYFGATAAGALQLTGLISSMGQELLQFGWQKLTTTGTQALTTGTLTYALPTGFGWYVPDTMMTDGSSNLADAPTSPQRWQLIKSTSGSGPGPGYRVRFFQDLIQVIDPTTGHTIRFEYVDNRPWQATGAGARKALPTVDTDVWLLDDQAGLLWLKWQLQAAKGMPGWRTAKAAWDLYASHRRGVESGAKTIVECGDSDDYTPPSPYTNLWVS